MANQSASKKTATSSGSRQPKRLTLGPLSWDATGVRQKLGTLQTQFVAALESGDYKQVNGFLEAIAKKNAGGKKLARAVRKHCCLGVACVLVEKRLELRVIRPALSSNGDTATTFESDTGSMPNPVVSLYRFHGEVGNLKSPIAQEATTARPGHRTAMTMADMNDNLKLSFKTIAKLIRMDPHNFFEGPA